MVAAGEQRRFRKRGGAKKKKKNDARDASSAPPDLAPRENEHHPHGVGAGEGEDPHQAAWGRQSYGGGEKGYGVGGHGYGGGGYGAGGADSHLDPELLSYLLKLRDDLEQLDPIGEVSAAWANSPDRYSIDDDVPPPPVLLARNALTELRQRVHEVARDSSGSRLFEKLLRYASDGSAVAAVLDAVLALGASRVSALAQHRNGSHVLETMLRMVSKESMSAEGVEAAMKRLVAVTEEWTADELLEIIQSSSASHVFRVVVASLAGLPEDEPKESKLDDSSPTKIRSYVDRMGVEVPDEWLSAVRSLAERILEEGARRDLLGLVWAPASCAALQALLSGVVRTDKDLGTRLAQALIGSQLEELMMNPCGSRFVERAVVCLGSSMVMETVKGRLAEFAENGRANFCVQRILLGINGRGAVMGAWDELEESVVKMMGFGSTREGVVLALLRSTEAEGDENCRRRASRCVAKASGATGAKAKELAGVISTGSDEIWSRWKVAVNELGGSGLGVRGRPDDVLRVPRTVPRLSLLGVLMARCLMRYPGGPGQGARDSMATLTPTELLALCGDVMGSRLVEQWLDSEESVGGGKNAGRVLACMFGENDMAGIAAASRNPYASRVLIRASGLVMGDNRKRVMEALAMGYASLRSDRHGRIVVRKCRVEQYMQRGDQWANEESVRDTRHRIFAEILVDDEDENRVNIGPVGESKEARKKAKDQRKKEKKETRQSLEKQSKQTKSSEVDDLVELLAPPVEKVGKGKTVERPTKRSKKSGKLLNEGTAEPEDHGEVGLDTVLGAIAKAAATPSKKGSKKKRKRSEKD